jgi:hypothetical protein
LHRPEVTPIRLGPVAEYSVRLAIPNWEEGGCIDDAWRIRMWVVVLKLLMVAVVVTAGK